MSQAVTTIMTKVPHYMMIRSKSHPVTALAPFRAMCHVPSSKPEGGGELSPSSSYPPSIQLLPDIQPPPDIDDPAPARHAPSSRPTSSSCLLSSACLLSLCLGFSFSSRLIVLVKVARVEEVGSSEVGSS